MVDRAAFDQHVEAALPHLYEHTYLQSHPLAALLDIGSTEEQTGESLHRVLFEAIEALKPVHSGSYPSAAWRRYSYLFLRYVEGRSPIQVARELGISERQSRRNREEALRALADLLWARYRARPGASAEGQWETAAAGPADGSPLTAEVDKLAGTGRRGPADLAEALASLLGMLGPLLRRDGVTVQPELPPGLAQINVERGVLRQALLEVLLVALDWAKGGEVTIVATPTAAGAEVRVTARPGGEAAPPASHHDRLAISRQLLEARGGALWAEVEQRTVELLLPTTTPETVLLVDDNPDILLLFRRFLGSARYRVLQAEDAATALRLAAAEQPALITLDLMMPTQDGWELLQALRESPGTRDVPVVVCSVLRERELALALGATDFLEKPVSQQQLLQALERCRRPAQARRDSPSDSA